MKYVEYLGLSGLHTRDGQSTARLQESFSSHRERTEASSRYRIKQVMPSGHEVSPQGNQRRSRVV
jgi:hypothetical protein